MLRVLITIKPRMYRESARSRPPPAPPNFEIRLAAVASLDGEGKSFHPHLLIRNDTDGADMDLMGGIHCWIEILYSDGMDARLSLAGEVRNIKGISTEDLLELVDRTEKPMLEGTPFG